MAGTFLAASLREVVRSLCVEKRIDLIHAHGALSCGHAAALLNKEFGVPFIVSVHGLDAFTKLQGGPLWGKWCCRRSQDVYSKAAAVVCVSEKVQHQVGTSGKTIVVHNGVDAQLFYPAAESSPLVVLSVGNLIASKGHALLLRAFSRASKSVPDCRLQIIGDGPERAHLVQLAKELGIWRRLDFLDQQPRESVALAMGRCAVFALPSSYEGLGCVYLEAMSSGKPAIGCTGQGIEDIIENGKNGMLISPGSVDQLAEALRTLLTNRDLRMRLGTLARETILQNHRLEHQAQELADLYRECAA